MDFYIMKSKPLAWSYRKIKWANAEIKKLDAKIKRRFRRDLYPTRVSLNAERMEETHEFRPPKVTADMQVSVKNILQNLREPLDNTLAVLSNQHGGKTSGLSFPFGERTEKYRAEIDKLKKLLPAGAIEVIEQALTYPGGNEHLRTLHYFTRDQRHRIPVDPINVGTTYRMRSLGMYSGRLIRLGYRYGAHMVPNAKNDLVVPDGVAQPEFLVDGGDGQPTIVFRPNIAAGDNQMEFITVTPGAKFEADLKPMFDVTLAEIPAFKREPIIITLHQMSQLVEGIVLAFEKRFFA
jgi:hypothetical protein